LHASDLRLAPWALFLPPLGGDDENLGLPPPFLATNFRTFDCIRRNCQVGDRV
jgi:hypothetical protein